MATRAVPPSKDVGLGVEQVARVAIHRRAIEVDVCQRGLLFVALSTNAGVGCLERSCHRIVTFVTLDSFIDDMLCVTLGKAYLGPVGGHLARRWFRSFLLDRLNVTAEPRSEYPRPEGNQRHHTNPKQRALHRPPTWQSLHGRSLALSRRLLKPIG